MISKEKIDEVVAKIVDNYKPEKIILFGSYAYGNPTEDSDLDFCVIKETDVPLYERGMEIRRILRGSMVPIDIFVYTPSEVDEWKDVKNSFMYTITKKGSVLYDKERAAS